MATVTRAGGEIVLRLSAREKLLSVHGDVRVPVAAVADVEVLDDAVGAVKGLWPRSFKIAGSYVPGQVALGLFFDGSLKRRQFAAAYRRRPRGVRISMQPGAKYTQLVVSVDDPAAVQALIAPRG